MKVVLIYPRLAKEDFGSGSYHMFLGIPYLASYLKQRNVDCYVIDCTFMRSFNELETELNKLQPDILGISFSSPLTELGFQAIEVVRRKLPNALIVVGGAHPTVDPVNVLKNRNVDIAVLGEGEETFYKLVSGINPSELDGVCYREGDKIVVNEKKKFIENLDILPFPARNLLDMKRYIKETGYVIMVTSRGCSGNCLYCQPVIRKLFGTRIRSPSPRYVIEEMKSIKEEYWKDDNFILLFDDDVFCFDKNRVMEICKLIKENDLDSMAWWCTGRIDHLDEEVVHWLKSAGCIGISLGIEFGSQKILNVMRKGTTIEQIKKAVSLCHRHGLIVLAFLMIGAPNETLEDMKETRNLIAKIHPDQIAISIVTPMLGSDLYDIAVERNLLNIGESSEFGYYGNTRPMKLDVSVEDLLKMKEEYRRVYFLNLYKNFWKYLKIFLSFKHTKLYIRKFIEAIRKKN